MVGGKIIEIMPIGKTPEGRSVSRLWCVDRSGDECAVHVEDAPAMPLLGDEVWWQAGKVYWDHDRRELRKVGYSYDPRAKV
ncbi:hypothetical protein BV394_01865 [Brevirhabdus pacifica]|uniref:Uncharacterized protein n=1 Tax=Brevirhabdus pacifica TaxID=1267768 RepID=A0A1U7DF50_9RHOB|nr:hypothetical protein [Brevirhabdus pacifica]APX88627.1 hypothetical protein BV394_01865 [Brevirhabdus pacifica]OWU79904.1 hypothetical protein ATO5_02560 [Loktanella sp. 22II-4b]PJJ86876.1 hypothetical protein CLV77_1436 [Brevirhabdus pacifica]